MTDEAALVMKEFLNHIFGNTDFEYCCNILADDYRHVAEDFYFADYDVLPSNELNITFDCVYIEKTKDWNERRTPFAGIAIDLNTYKLNTYTDFN